MSISLNGDGIVSGVTTFTTPLTGVTTFTNGLEVTGGSVGIGTDNPLTKFHVNSGTNANFGVTTAAGELSLECFNDVGSANIPLNVRASEYKIKIGGDEKVSITSGGNVQIANGNLVFSTSGTGIDFSATSDATGMTSELLDDYEEGTWTPANSVTTLTNLTTATYTKVGRFVYVNFDFTLATNASSSAVAITGLPFTAGSQCFGVIMSDNFNILNAFPFVASGSTTMQFQFSATSGGSRDTVAYSRIVSGGVVRGSLCYIV